MPDPWLFFSVSCRLFAFFVSISMPIRYFYRAFRFFGQALDKVGINLLHKGCHVYIEGHLSTRCWRDDTGQKHYASSIVGRELQLLSPAKQMIDDQSL